MRALAAVTLICAANFGFCSHAPHINNVGSPQLTSRARRRKARGGRTTDERFMPSNRSARAEATGTSYNRAH
jgi:hypothetical protein